MDASRNGRQVRALVPSAVGFTNAPTNEMRRIPLQDHASSEENGEGFAIGSASVISVFTSFLTAIAVYPATASEASQPPTAKYHSAYTLVHETRP